MGKLRDDDQYADVILDAAELGTHAAASRHGLSERHVRLMEDAVASGGRVPGAGNVDARYIRARLKGRIREAQLMAQLAIAKASEREANAEDPNPQAIMALAAAAKSYEEIEEAREDMDLHLANIEARAEERRRNQAARLTEGEEVPQLPAGPRGKPATGLPLHEPTVDEEPADDDADEQVGDG